MPMAARTAVATIAGLVVVALVGALALWGLAPAPAAAADDGVSAVNGDRSSNGLGAVTDSGGLDGLAERHSQQMADRASHVVPHHLGSAVSKAGIDWKRVGENVGVGGSTRVQPSASVTILASWLLVMSPPGRYSRQPEPQLYPEMMPWLYAVSM